MSQALYASDPPLESAHSAVIDKSVRFVGVWRSSRQAHDRLARKRPHSEKLTAAV